ncbi:DUF2591 domain-containing protein [Vibrio natriegens]|uniref:phage protein NinX family protein n=1 Tax=Vibrio natriegens TaxID=691 RepID=UPI001EFE617D|nr:phage protein NinX family protein [Vibrio natriegens]MCG9699668.1 DUF2591 domain-containing protein [Vibrio natriegens]
MKNYEGMTDGQINFEVAKIWFAEFKLLPNDDDVSVFVSESTDRFDFMSIRNSAFNPCHDSSHAWPIIIENKISLTTEDGSDDWHADVVACIDENGKGVIMDVKDECHAYDPNPLRAAMICFLKMKDAEVSV